MPVPYLTMADICAIWHIPLRTARRRAQHDKWRRTSGRPRRYNTADVEASLGRPRRNTQAQAARRAARVRKHLATRYGPG